MVIVNSPNSANRIYHIQEPFKAHYSWLKISLPHCRQVEWVACPYLFKSSALKAKVLPETTPLKRYSRLILHLATKLIVTEAVRSPSLKMAPRGQRPPLNSNPNGSARFWSIWNGGSGPYIWQSHRANPFVIFPSEFGSVKNPSRDFRRSPLRWDKFPPFAFFEFLPWVCHFFTAIQCNPPQPRRLSSPRKPACRQAGGRGSRAWIPANPTREWHKMVKKWQTQVSTSNNFPFHFPVWRDSSVRTDDSMGRIRTLATANSTKSKK